MASFDDLGLDVTLARHPGPPSARRVQWVKALAAPGVALHVARGKDLYETLIGWAKECDVDGAAFSLCGGVADWLEVMTGKPDTQTERVATFHGPHVVECPARILGGHGLIGTEKRGHVLHTHAAFESAHGDLMGCHLIRGACIAAAEGIEVMVYPLFGARFVAAEDRETQFELLHPEKCSRPDPPGKVPRGKRVLLVKLQPNQDVYGGIEQACIEAGLTRVEVLSGVGSLNDAWLVNAGQDTRLELIKGPGLEVAGISGLVHVGARENTLSAWITRMDGGVTGGRLARGRNVVCITFEFVLTEV